MINNYLYIKLIPIDQFNTNKLIMESLPYELLQQIAQGLDQYILVSVSKYISKCFNRIKHNKIQNMRLAAKHGHLHILQWYVAIGNHIQCCTINEAALAGNLCCLKFACENNDIWINHYYWTSGYDGYHINLLKRIHQDGLLVQENVCAYAALGGHLECLIYLHDTKECQFTNNICEYAAVGGNLACLKYVISRGCKINKDICAYAALGGNLDCLKYTYAILNTWCNHSCNFAALGGNLECLKYMHQNGCEFDYDSDIYIYMYGPCEFAAKYGYLACLKYLHENGCKWTQNTCALAARNGHIECLKYAYENGCPWSLQTYENAVISNDKTVIDYCIKNGLHN